MESEDACEKTSTLGRMTSETFLTKPTEQVKT